MKTIAKAQFEALEAQASQILTYVADGKSTREILAQIYVENLDEKTTAQGEIMADAILCSVKEFDMDYAQAQENLDGFIERFMDEIAKGKTLEERCEYWLKLAAALSAATAQMNDEGADREAILAMIDELSIGEGEATEARENELRAQATEAIRSSGVMLGALVQQADALEQMPRADEAAGLLIDLGNREIEYRAIIAMLAYVKAQNGEIKELPANMTVAQVAAIVFAQSEQLRIVDAVNKGHLATDVAALLLSILGIVVLAKVFVPLIVIGVSAAAAVFGAILAIPAALLVIFGLYRLFHKAASAWMNDSKRFVDVVSVGIRAMAKGFGAVVAFVRDNILSKLVKDAKERFERLRSETNAAAQMETARA